MYANGVNFDCASKRELDAIKDLGGKDTAIRVIYANPCKSIRDLVAAAALGSPQTVVDSVEEVIKLDKVNYKGKTLIRLAVDDSQSLMPFSSKFGARACMIHTIAHVAAIHKIQISGFSFHVGSGGSSGKAYTDAIKQCRAYIPSLIGYGHRPDTIDIGGGFLACENDLKEKALCIREAIAGLNNSYIKVIAEPGRFFATNAFDFYVMVIGKKYSHNTGLYYYTIDDSIYGQFTNILFDHAKPIWRRVSTSPRPRVSGVLFGRTCDSVDVIAQSTDMEDLKIGDWLVFPNMGAYTRATASEFNGFPRPEVIVIDSDPKTHTMIKNDPKDVSYPSPVKSLLTASRVNPVKN